jgi:hypothetical protein
MTAVNWMPKKIKYKSKYSNPNDIDISISTQHIDRIGFSFTISQENIPVNKYFIILKNSQSYISNLNEQREYNGMERDVQRML